MRTVHKSNSGFGLVGILIVAATVGLVGLAGWFVYRAQAVKSYEQCTKAGGMAYETYPPTCKIHGRTFTQPAVTSNVSLDTPVDTELIHADKTLELPATWKQIEGADDRLTFGGGPNECALTASVLTDDKAKRANAGDYTQVLFQGDRERLTSKGYAITKLDPSTLKVDGGDGAATYTTLELRATRNGQVERDTYAYIVGDGKVGRIELYCKGSDYWGGQMESDRSHDINDLNDLQVIWSILQALHFKVLS